MPILSPLPSDTEPGATYTAWTWGPGLRVDAGSQMIVVEFESYASSTAAYGGGKPVAKTSQLMAGKDFRNFVRNNPGLYMDLMNAIDAMALAMPQFAGGSIVAAVLPGWASEPIEE